MILRVATVLMAALFAYAAVVNLNDPDPMRWVAIYTAGSVVSLAGWWRGLPAGIPAAVAVVAAVWAAWVGVHGIPESHPMPGFPQVGPLREEVVREGLGLALVAVWMAALAVRAALIDEDELD